MRDIASTIGRYATPAVRMADCLNQIVMLSALITEPDFNELIEACRDERLKYRMDDDDRAMLGELADALENQRDRMRKAELFLR